MRKIRNGYPHQLEFSCRDCMIQGREKKWKNFLASNARDYENSWLTLKPEAANQYDPTTIRVIFRGGVLGTAGYVGWEFTQKIKGVLDRCEEYRLDITEPEFHGSAELTLVLSWREPGESFADA